MVILSIPLDDPGEDKYTALMAHLRILGAPQHYCVLPHAHIVAVLHGLAMRKVRSGPFMNWLLAERMYLTLGYDNQTFDIGKKDQTDD